MKKAPWTLFKDCPPPPFVLVEVKTARRNIIKIKCCWSGKPLDQYKIPKEVKFVAWRPIC